MTMEDDECILSTAEETFIVYRKRWFVLFIVSALNVTNAAVWISFAPVADIAANYYEVSVDDINWFSMVFFIASIFPGVFIMWFVDQKGLKKGILIGQWLNAFGPAIRAISTASFIPMPYQFPFSMLGQTVTACAQPFFFFIQTKVAEQWFPDYQRTLATTIISLANPLGIMIGTGVTPLFVKSNEDIPLLNSMLSIPAVIVAAIALCGIRSSRPPTPPSSSAAITSKHPYFQGVKEVFKNRAYWLLLLYIGCILGAFSALMTMMEEIMCARGYSNWFSGLCAALMIGCGLVGGGVVSVIADKTKKFSLIMKVCICLVCNAVCCFAVITRYNNMEYAVAIICSLIGLTGFSTYPIGLELGVECSFPVTPEATSTGFLMISGQVQGIIFLLLMKGLSTDLPSGSKTCQMNLNEKTLPHDMTVSLLVLAGIVVACGSVFILFFDTEYKRIKADRIQRVNEILNSSTANSIVDSFENSLQVDIACP